MVIASGHWGTKSSDLYPRLRLVDDHGEDPDVFLFDEADRRASTRVPARGEGVATFIDADGQGCLTNVTVLDRSAEGVGVRCRIRIPEGASFEMVVDGVKEWGVVAHTEPGSEGYRVGLRLGRRVAA